MTNCISEAIRFKGVKGRKVEAIFSGQTITSDGGSLLLRAADENINLLSRAARCFSDTRRQASCAHSVENFLRQRVYALTLGYEDLNDHNDLRHDPALQTAVGRDVDEVHGHQEGRFSMAIITIIVFCRCMFFVETICLPPILDPATRMRQSILWAFSDCW